ncbi:glycine dehydrogenase (decarboxylating), mitochondrial-like [Paramacrobiotus metropolitanus]|uniref:glycine dehydrogenase (decarboxylating), mitochondrial-like n=1 Tax=Paramacrobiotus metropolitanus TaxID=2943436 RepID=UPI00244573C3|nr:glycine dehydrogenase (decarboxylating), mitochondrial-like [Paramacrobiotus metropolitanus]
MPSLSRSRLLQSILGKLGAPGPSLPSTVHVWSLRNHVAQQGRQLRLVSSTTGFHNVPRPSKSVQIDNSASADSQQHDQQNTLILQEFFRGNDNFAQRHIGPREAERDKMLNFIGCEDFQDLLKKTLPEDILLNRELQMDAPLGEYDLMMRACELAAQNEVWRSYLGLGYYNTRTVAPIVRNILENPGWYTQYTPYQPEISQGRLESLLNYQTMVSSMTGLPIANASLLDEATAAGEAMALAFRQTKRKKFFLDAKMHPQTIAVVKARAEPIGVEVVSGSFLEADLSGKDFGGVLFQYPDTEGGVPDFERLKHAIAKIKAQAIVGCATDLLSLTLLVPPGDLGCDIAVGNTQRFGVPLFFGGPHAAFFSVAEKYKRQMPGRMVGVTRDRNGAVAYRLALQAREQHIRRDKATSNICTAQALLANMASMYAVYHGPVGLRRIASKCHASALLAADVLQHCGYVLRHKTFFDTIKLGVPDSNPSIMRQIQERAREKKINFRYYDDGDIGVAMDETVTQKDLEDILYVFGVRTTIPDALREITGSDKLPDTGKKVQAALPGSNLIHMDHPWRRQSEYLEQPIFNIHHCETELTRYIKRLENKDISLVHAMIPLGSCTMKLNAASEMMPVSLPGFANIHPFVPHEQTKGYQTLVKELERDLCEITGYDKFSFQPNSGAAGEYAGLRTIMAYLKATNQGHRNICLIPASAHGTNPASAQMAGLKVEVVACTKDGTINVEEFKKKAEQHRDRLACAMITYPSTNGVFEDTIRNMCDLVHKCGGQVYLDGANLNALVGLARPGDFGSDVSHLNLHKTFCIPHGGGGPGMGPIGVKSHLAPFLPDHPFSSDKTSTSCGAVSAAPFGSAGILPISWAYIKMMGAKGLHRATEIAVLSANYMAHKLSSHYRILCRGTHGYVAHEFILDCRGFKESAGIEAVDIAKRLQDYGFHAPTMSWPVTGTLMVEPTESETLAELDRFCDALINIRKEISEIESIPAGSSRNGWTREVNPLKMAPHTQWDIGGGGKDWKLPYSISTAAFPTNKITPTNKVWPGCSRADDLFGDQNLICACPPTELYVAGQPLADEKPAH